MCAFCRKSADAAVLVVVPRMVAGLVGLSNLPPVGPTTWEDTQLLLPKGFTGRRFANLFTGYNIPACQTCSKFDGFFINPCRCIFFANVTDDGEM